MRVYISVDLEGINGICHSSHTQPGEPAYERAVQLMHNELNALIQGARSGGATEIVVNDSHWDMRNVRPELLEPGTHLLTGWQKPYSMVSGINGSEPALPLSERQFDVVFFLGYHAMAGHPHGVLSHTYRSQVFLQIELNNAPVGETGINAALAGHFGVPVGLVSGDDIVCKEATDLLGTITCVPVKKAVSRYSAIFRPYQETLAELKQAATETLRDRSRWKIYKAAAPATFRITMIDPSMADAAELLPMVKRLDGRTVEFSHDDYSVLFRLMLAIGALGASRKDPHF